MKALWKDLLFGCIVAGGFIIGAAIVAPEAPKPRTPGISQAEFRSLKADVAEHENRLRQNELALLLTIQTIKILVQTQRSLDERCRKTNDLYQQQLVQIQEHCAQEIDKIKKQAKRSCWE